MNTKQHLNVISLIVLSSMLLLAGCDSDTLQEITRKNIAVVTPYMANETTKYVIEKFRANAKDRGWKTTVTDTAGDFDLLVSCIEDAIKQKADAIVLGMGDPAKMTKGLEAAQQANIPVFGLDAGVAPGVILNVTSDNSELGSKSAEALAKAIGEKGNVIMFTHDLHPGVRERAAAAEAVFDNYRNINIIKKIHIDVPGPVDSARKVTEDLFKDYSDKNSIGGIWAGWDEPALGAYQIIQIANRGEIKVIGIDGTNFAKIEIAKGGSFIGSVAQDFDGMANKLTELIDNYFQGQKPIEEWYKIPGKLITKDNIDRSQ